jgi:hypothetical protein
MNRGELIKLICPIGRISDAAAAACKKRRGVLLGLAENTGRAMIALRGNECGATGAAGGIGAAIHMAAARGRWLDCG